MKLAPPPMLTERVLPSSLLNFLAGLLAGAGINLLTAVETGPTEVPSGKIVVDSTAWVAASVFAAWAAHIANGAERRADLAMDEHLTAEEKNGIFRTESARISGKFWSLVSLTAASVLLAILLIPRLVI
ncbi:hypothetical protein [Actinomadura sp. DC4]|uniref:hypothetical protein n=1 Tax=Actinomadura sp. DC4 TaxID=3055069 RepID=UPI0025AED39A|nr:hypothetical protein [Actinomadura sp. DC4]MDN3351648.1 hypothetical protein [Actinomadura sp. DC4]